MLRIREAESTQTIGDLRQKIAELEVQVTTKKPNFSNKILFIYYRIKN